MGGTSTDEDDPPLAPDDAFAAIGHEIRVQIVEALARTDRADRPLAFSELRDRVGTADSAKFNYHLDRLVGHFLERTDDGYDLRRAGERVAEAILSGAVTDDPVLERTEVDSACHYCGAPIEVSYREERIAAYCTECPGTYGERSADGESADDGEADGFLGYLYLPPVSLADRTPTEAHRAAIAWQVTEQLLAADGTCPRCSAPMDEWVTVCEDHDATDGSCGACNRRYAAHHSSECTNCVYSHRVAFGLSLVSHVDLQAFLTTHGVNVASPDAERFFGAMLDYEEEIREAEPFAARFTFELDGDRLSLTVDDDFDVVDVDEQPGEA
ncbi:MAG: hypothetical protein ABEJ88_00815 [Halobacterium sp.]